ncbi:DUF6612 family protein [Paenibacillus thermoaerophilus]|uniref:DUF6612 family protein n=1 Tax=Paenibacillus thermoaerophilus TaxID=1215385 RepID=A0ABW2V6N6_9BACL|nr:DUF6612 family protein [Paenibacillus thermoaerophilus]TMV18520.1 hypothetical protein FE781_03670 [Paenibacillus thermoaerophilus]
MASTKALPKLLAAVLLTAGTLTLAACGAGKNTDGETGSSSSASPSAAASASPPASAQPTVQPSASPASLSAADIYAKSTEATAKLDSFAVSMNMKQLIDQGGNKLDVDTDIVMDLALKPKAAFKQQMTMKAQGQQLEMELYLIEDGLFLKEPTSGQWARLPAEQLEQVMQGISQEALDPAKQLEKMKPFLNDLAMSESDSHYTIKLSASGDKFNNFLRKELENNASLGGGGANLGTLGMNVKKADYTFSIDKKTFYPDTMKIEMDMEMNNQGQPFNISQTMQGEYSKFNEIKEITVPSEALNAPEVTAPQ